MPPSGYSRIQAAAIGEFLQSCWNALIGESKNKNIAVDEAITLELSQISEALQSNGYDIVTSKVLELTLEFYSQVLEAMDSVKDIDQLASSVIEVITRNILNVHIET